MGSAGAQGTLNLPLSRLDGGTVRSGKITADGMWAVYAADQEVLGSVELYSVPLEPGARPVRISPPFHSSSGYRWDVSPDSRRAVFVLGTDLYSVPIDRSASPVRLSEQPVRHAGSASFRISPDGSHVAYLGAPANAYLSLYGVAIDGSSAPFELQPASAVGGVQSQYEFSPDGATVVFRSNHESPLLGPLYAVRMSGGPVVQLSQPIAGNGHFNSMKWRFANGGERLVFLSADEALGQPQLYGVPLDGSALPERLNGALTPDGAVLDFDVSRDGERVVYLADQRQNDKQELFGVPADGSAPALVLSAPLLADRDVTAFELHPGSTLVAYRSDQEIDGRFELYGVPLDGSRAPLKLSPPLPPGSGVGWSAFTPDGRHLLVSLTPPPPFSAPYELWRVALARGLPRAKLAESARFQQPRVGPDGAHVLYVSNSVLYGVAVAGGSAPVVLAATHPPAFEFHPDGARVLLQLRDGSSNVHELFLRRADAGQPAVKLNGPLVLGEVVADVASFETTPDGRWLVYHADGIDRDEDPDVGDELFALRTDVPASPVRLFPQPTVLGGLDDVQEYRLDARNERVVVYTRDAESEFFEGRLHALSLDGSHAPVVLNSFSAIRRFELSPDGTWVVFSVDMDDAAGSERLFASRADGSAIEVELSGALAGPVRDFAISADGSTVVFLARRATGGGHELVRVPIDGSSPPLALGGAPVAGGDVHSFLMDPHSLRVVYRADQQTNGVDELWSVPLAGGVAPTRLNGALVAGGDVLHFRLSADGARVVYSADQVTDQALQLFAVPAGGGPAWSLAPAFAPGRQIFALEIVPGDAAVVYGADALTAGVRELFLVPIDPVPIDGSTSPTNLSGPLVAGGDVRDGLELASDGARVVFLADARVDEQVELFSTRLLPGAPRVLLSGALGSAGDVRALRLSPDGRRVAYLADAVLDETLELFGVPIEGGLARRLSAKLPAGRDVELGFRFDALSQRVLYVADELEDEIRELFGPAFERVTLRGR